MINIDHLNTNDYWKKLATLLYLSSSTIVVITSINLAINTELKILYAILILTILFILLFFYYFVAKNKNIEILFNFTPLLFIFFTAISIYFLKNLTIAITFIFLFPLASILKGKIKQSLFYNFIFFLLLLLYFVNYTSGYQNYTILSIIYVLNLFIQLTIIMSLRQILRKYNVINEQLELTQKQSNVGSWTYIFETNDLFCSDNLFTMFDVDRSSPNLSHSFFSKVHPDDITMLNNKIRLAKETREAFNTEYRFIKDDNSILYIYSNGKALIDKDSNIYGLYGITMDISERKTFEKNLIDNELLSNSLLSISKNAESIDTVSGLTDLISLEIQKNFQVFHSWLFLVDETEQKLKYSGDFSETDENFRHKLYTTSYNDNNYIKNIIHSNDIYYFNKQEDNSEGFVFFDKEYKSIINIPIFYKNTVIAIFGMGTLENEPMLLLSEYQKKYLDNFANLISSIIHRITQDEINYYSNQIIEFTSFELSKFKGQEYYQKLSLKIIDLIKPDAFIIGSYNNNSIHTKTFYISNEIQNNFTYSTEFTPCEKVIEYSSYFNIDDVQNKYPKDQILIDLDANKYVGIALTDNNNITIGIIIALFKSEQIESIILENIFRIISIPTSSEMQRTNNETMLINAKKRYQSYINQIHEAVLRLEFKKGLNLLNSKNNDINNAVIVEVNKHFYQLFEENPESDKNEYNLAEFFDESFINTLVKNKFDLKEYELTISTNSGKRKHVLINSSAFFFDESTIKRAWITIKDTTETKKKESALLESEERYRSLIDNSPDGILLFDMKKYEVIEVNQKICELFKYEHKSEIIGHSPIHFSPEFQRDNVPTEKKAKDYLNRAMNGENLLFEWLHKDKNENIIECDIRLTRVSIDGHYYIRASILDITERKKLEKEKEQVMNEIRSINEEMENIIYIASHDLRTPLVNIHGFSNELVSLGEDLKKILANNNISNSEINNLIEFDLTESIHYIQSSTQKMDRLLNSLLKLSRMGRSDLYFETLNLNALIPELLDSYKFTLDKINATVRIKDLPSIYGDKSQILQVFSNLIENAIKYRKNNQDLIIEFKSKTDDNYIYIYLSDNGIGINKSQLSNVFEIFKRLSPDEYPEGEGIGLTITKRIIKRHNADIFVESKEGDGSTFIIKFKKINNYPMNND